MWWWWASVQLVNVQHWAFWHESVHYSRDINTVHVYQIVFNLNNSKSIKVIHKKSHRTVCTRSSRLHQSTTASESHYSSWCKTMNTLWKYPHGIRRLFSICGVNVFQLGMSGKRHKEEAKELKSMLLLLLLLHTQKLQVNSDLLSHTPGTTTPGSRSRRSPLTPQGGGLTRRPAAFRVKVK